MIREKLLPIFLGTLLATSSVVTCPKPASAFFLLPPGPFTPTLDFLTDPLEVLNSVSKGLAEAQAMYSQVASEANNLVNAVNSVATPFTNSRISAFDKLFPAGNGIVSFEAGRGLTASCGNVDIYNVLSVEESMQRNFFQYPSNNVTDKADYREFGKRFTQDSLIDTYTAVRDAEKRMMQLRSLVDKLPQNLREGTSGSKPGEDKLAVLENERIAKETSDKVLQLLEEVVAIRNQYEASKYVQEGWVAPAPYVSKKDKDTSDEDKSSDASSVFENNIKSASFSEHSTLVFAAMADEQDVEEEEEEFFVPDITFEKAPDSETVSPFEGTEEQLEAMKQLDPINEAAIEALETHNMINALPSYKNIFEDYNRHVKLHEKTVEDIKLSDQCVMQFLGRYYQNAQQTWIGGDIGDLVNYYDLRSGLSGWAIKSFELLKAQDITPVNVDSFSAVDLGDIAKPEDVNTVGDIDAVVDVNPNMSGLRDPSQEKEIAASTRETKMLAWIVGKEAAKMLVRDQYSTSPQWGTPIKRFPIWTDQKNFYSQYIDGKYDNIKVFVADLDLRAAIFNISLLVNEAETERKIAELEEPTPENIEAERTKGQERHDELIRLAQSMSSDIESTLGTSSAPAGSGDDYEIERLNNNFGEAIAKSEQGDEDIKADLEKQQTQDIDKLTEDKNSKVGALEARKASIYTEVDAKSKTLDAYNQVVEELKQQIERARYEASTLKDQEKMITEYYGEKVDTSKEAPAEDFEETVIYESTSDTAASGVNGKNIKQIRATTAEIQAEIDGLRNSIAAIDDEIEVIETAHVNSVSEIKSSYASKTTSALEKAAEIRQALKDKAASVLTFYNAMSKVPGANSLLGTAVFGQVASILDRSQDLVDAAAARAQRLIQKAHEDLYGIGENLYLPLGSEKAMLIHSNLMDNLMSLSVDDLISSSSVIGAYSGVSSIIDALSGIYRQALLRSSCSSDACKTEDSEYFIGISPKSRDLYGPKAPPPSYYPPMREVVHFDDFDFDNVPQGLNGKVTKDGFMSYGGEIPEVWKYILDEKIFVETHLDLEKVLKAGGEPLSFINGGLYPCNNGGKTLSIDVEELRYMVNNQVSGSSDYPSCAAVEIASGAKLAGLNKFYYDIRDIEIDKTGPSVVTSHPTMFKIMMLPTPAQAVTVIDIIKSKNKDTLATNTSELGTLLKLDKNSLYFADLPYKVFTRIKEIGEEASDPNSDYEPNITDQMYTRAQFNNNQIGDFLGFVERELEARQARDELGAKMVSVRDTLNEALQKAGYEPSEDLDLSNPDDYALVRSKLDKTKNDKVNKAVEDMKEVKITDEVLTDRLNYLKNIFTALQKDKDELIGLAATTPADSSLDEAIKTEEANQGATDKYSKRADEEFEKRINSSPRPFCAIY